MTRKVFVVSESRSAETVTTPEKRPGPATAFRGWLLGCLLLASLVVSMALWLNNDDESSAPAPPVAVTRGDVPTSFELRPEIAADPFGVRDWGGQLR